MVEINWNAVSSFATSVAAIGTFWTVKELKRQSLVGMRPDLVLVTNNFYIQSSRDENDPIWLTWKAFKVNQGESQEDGPFCFRFVNVGLGPARMVSLKWTYQLDALISTARRFALVDQVACRENDGVHFVSTSNSLFNETIFREQLFDVCLTANLDPIGVGFEIPPFIQYLVAKAVSELLKDGSEDCQPLRDALQSLFGADEIEVNYRDLLGRKYKKTFKIRFQVSAIGEYFFSGRFHLVCEQ